MASNTNNSADLSDLATPVQPNQTVQSAPVQNQNADLSDLAHASYSPYSLQAFANNPVTDAINNIGGSAALGGQELGNMALKLKGYLSEPLNDPISSNNFTKAQTPVIPPFYNPQGTSGEIESGIGKFLPYALGAEASLPATASSMIAPGVAGAVQGLNENPDHPYIGTAVGATSAVLPGIAAKLGLSTLKGAASPILKNMVPALVGKFGNMFDPGAADANKAAADAIWSGDENSPLVQSARAADATNNFDNSGFVDSMKQLLSTFQNKVKSEPGLLPQYQGGIKNLQYLVDNPPDSFESVINKRQFINQIPRNYGEPNTTDQAVLQKVQAQAKNSLINTVNDNVGNSTPEAQSFNNDWQDANKYYQNYQNLSDKNAFMQRFVDADNTIKNPNPLLNAYDKLPQPEQDRLFNPQEQNILDSVSRAKTASGSNKNLGYLLTSHLLGAGVGAATGQAMGGHPLMGALAGLGSQSTAEGLSKNLASPGVANTLSALMSKNVSSLMKYPGYLSAALANQQYQNTGNLL